MLGTTRTARRTQWGWALGVWGLVNGVGIGMSSVEAVPAREVSSPFTYRFHVDGMLEEAGSESESSSPYFWLNSGGRLNLANGVGATIHGDLAAPDKWYTIYLASNPTDTDWGAHPQNIFRLLTRSRWENFTQSVSFQMTKLNVSASPERDGWSGILLFNRYLDSDNLYYIGLRHDGDGVIKKKRYGVYYTLAQGPAFTAEASYERDTVPNLMPGQVWMGLKSVVQTNTDSTVTLQLWLDRQLTGNWELVLETVDTNGGADGAPILGDGFAGIRTDFMDVEFDDHRLERLY